MQLISIAIGDGLSQTEDARFGCHVNGPSNHILCQHWSVFVICNSFGQANSSTRHTDKMGTRGRSRYS